MLPSELWPRSISCSLSGERTAADILQADKALSMPGVSTLLTCPGSHLHAYRYGREPIVLQSSSSTRKPVKPEAPSTQTSVDRLIAQVVPGSLARLGLAGLGAPTLADARRELSLAKCYTKPAMVDLLALQNQT